VEVLVVLAAQTKLGREPAATGPPLDQWVDVPAGRYRLGERGAERCVRLAAFRIGRYPVTEEQFAQFLARTDAASPRVGPDRTSALARHPATDVTYADAEAFCEWAGSVLGYLVCLPTGDEWEAAARGTDRRHWPWGDTFDHDRCATVEAGWGWTVPVDTHPAGASPFGVEQMAGNVWEWVSDPTEGGLWRAARGGSYLDHAWGVRPARALAADPDRATHTTGFRLVTDQRRKDG
jgi:formylglycine-generating enzyme required for sulfatase activity